MVFATLLAVAALISGEGFAQEVPRELPQAQGGATATVEDVEVAGRPLRQEVQSFVREIAAPPPGRVLARWHRSVCIGVLNLDARYAQFMIDRVATVALDAGIDVGPPGCRPNVIVMAASDAGALARALVADDPVGFRPAVNATDVGSAALARFQTTDAPVRWWHVSLPVGVDTGEVAVAKKGEKIVGSRGPEALTLRVRDPSRLRANTRDDLARVLIIVHVTKVGSVGFGALSDYVAMVSLAQVQADAGTSPYDTALNLFQDGADHTASLTQWDQDYLKSLYDASRDRARASQQTRDIYRGIVGERRTRANDDLDQ